MSGLTLAVPSKGRLEELTREWFASKGLTITRPGGARSYLGAIDGLPEITVRYSAMPARAKCWRVMVIYLVAMRIQRPCRARKSEATSARSCICVTSIQASGTATTTSAPPKSSAWAIDTEAGPLSLVSWIRSRPVTPKSIVPRISSRAISEAGKKRTVISGSPSMAPR